MAAINLMNLPECQWEQISYLILPCIEENMKASIKYIKSDFEFVDLLNSCAHFIDFDLLDGFKSEIRIVGKIGFFPAIEAQGALGSAIQQALLGYYRSAYDNLRRAFEMICAAVYYSAEKIKVEDSHAWLNSERSASKFDYMLRTILQLEHFKKFDKMFKWQKKVRDFYTLLSEFVHIKGYAKGTDQLSDFKRTMIDGMQLPNLSLTSLAEFLNNYILFVREVCAIMALYNPILLVGLPLEEKYGLHGPISGYFNEGQAEALKFLLPSEYHEFFNNLQTDFRVKAMTDFFEHLPDVTADVLKKQIELQND